MPIKLPKGCTEERFEELRVWAYRVWDQHWGVRIKNSAPVSNSRAQFLQYTVRDFSILTPDLMNQIELAVQAYTKHLHSKKRAGDRLIGVKTLSVWYNQSCYEDQFIDESAASIADRTIDRFCTHPGCKAKTHGPAYSLCTDHLPESGVAQLRDAYRELELDPKKGSLTKQLKTLFAVKRDEMLLGMEPDIEVRT